MNWMIEPFKKYATFTGRARRKEYWMFYLFNMIVSVVLGAVSGVLGALGGASVLDYFGIEPALGQSAELSGGLFVLSLIVNGLASLYSLAVIVPSIAVTVRRLHDTGKSGWWYFINFIPCVGGIWMLVLMASGGFAGDNEYGPDPKAAERPYYGRQVYGQQPPPPPPPFPGDQQNPPR